MATSAPLPAEADDQSAPTNSNPNSPAAPEQPNQYGGNFGNGVQPVLNDPNRGSNQRADANRGDFGAQSHQGHSHGGYGDQARAHITEHQDEHGGAAEARYYGDGNVRPGTDDQNAYRTYDGQDARPEFQGHAVRDTPAPVGEPSPTTETDGRGNTQDTRNLPNKTGPEAAFQNDNGAPTVGAAFAADYGHTSGVGLPPGTADHHLPAGPNGHGVVGDQRSSRGGYDNQGSQGGTHHPDAAGPATPPGPPAPVGAPAAPQGEGYGYGHERSEQTQPGRPDTGEARSGFEQSAAEQPGDTSQGLGSEGGSYDDANPGAHGPEYDEFTPEDKAQNYGAEAREAFRPENNPDDKSDTAPRRNAGRD